MVSSLFLFHANTENGRSTHRSSLTCCSIKTLNYIYVYIYYIYSIVLEDSRFNVPLSHTYAQVLTTCPAIPDLSQGSIAIPEGRSPGIT